MLLTTTIVIGLLSFLSPSWQKQDVVERDSRSITFGPGEEITYKVHYGFINAGEAQMVVGEDVHYLNGASCYKIDIYGQSVGMFDVFAKINDNWGTYLDTATLRPTRFYRKLKEGKYRKNEFVDFNHSDGRAETNEYSFSQKQWKPAVNNEVPANVQDMVSAYYYMRTLNFEELEAGDIVTVDAFFDQKLYNFRIRVVGREEVKTKLGKIRSLVFSPIMPENSMFDGENSIKVWLSDDINKVPLKVKASMFVGAVEIDIESFSKGKVK